ncbi:hypothetical protein [Ruminococcus sp. zg-924]|uniref:hypothetical protein n=1 Tax=Ruminococcus sp. zg-924 TaxID=2678505 RepID=UPI00210DF64B|nr:hypothetical protein [Ruminococcus sp. zg-924]
MKSIFSIRPSYENTLTIGADKVFQLFKKNSKAMVFVDYEYWFYSYRNLFQIKPDPKRFHEALIKEFDIADIMIFGDFSDLPISAELGKLRNITNTIIETGNRFPRHKKDMTDFVMLDYIYRCVDDNKNIGTYIIFSGKVTSSLS